VVLLPLPNPPTATYPLCGAPFVHPSFACAHIWARLGHPSDCSTLRLWTTVRASLAWLVVFRRVPPAPSRVFLVSHASAGTIFTVVHPSCSTRAPFALLGHASRSTRARPLYGLHLLYTSPLRYVVQSLACRRRAIVVLFSSSGVCYCFCTLVHPHSGGPLWLAVVQGVHLSSCRSSLQSGLHSGCTL